MLPSVTPMRVASQNKLIYRAMGGGGGYCGEEGEVGGEGEESV